MLQCLVVAARPLRVAELAEIPAFDFSAKGIPKLNPGWRWEDHEEAVMSTCSSLVIIVEDKSEDSNKDKNEDSRIVQFSHFSVKEFLMSSRFAKSSRDVSYYHVEPETAHTIVAQACLGILLQLDDRMNRNKIKNFPLAKYAARYWVKHAQAENLLSQIKDGIERLFDPNKPHFAAWLWIYNEDIGGSSMVTMFPTTPAAVPLYHAARFGFS